MDDSDISCGIDVECDIDKSDYEFRIYLAQFINWFVNRTFREVGFILDTRKNLFKIQVFQLYSENEVNGLFLELIRMFNSYMTENATILFNDTSIYDMDLYPDPPQLLQGTPTADFYDINGEQINTKIINLFIAAHIIHKILSESSERGPPIRVRVSQLLTYMELLPSNDDELKDDYLQTLGSFNPNDVTLALIKSATPLQAEIILHAENFEYYKIGRHSILDALARYPILAIEDLYYHVRPPPPNSGGAKKRNKSKRRKQKKSNKKSRRHHTRKRVSRIRNAKRFY
jgi:hypothetical protein